MTCKNIALGTHRLTKPVVLERRSHMKVFFHYFWLATLLLVLSVSPVIGDNKDIYGELGEKKHILSHYRASTNPPFEETEQTHHETCTRVKRVLKITISCIIFSGLLTGALLYIYHIHGDNDFKWTRNDFS